MINWFLFCKKKLFKHFSSLNNLLLLFVLFVFGISYFRVPFIFFQQDEWLGFGSIIGYGGGFVFESLKEGINHLVPVTFFLDYLAFKSFGLNNIYYNLLGLTIHGANGFLTYLIVLGLLKNKKIALVSTLLFLSSSIASQFIMWPEVSMNTIALTFSLLAILVVIHKSKFQNRLFPSVLLAIITLAAFLTIEYSLGLIFFIPIFVVVLSERKSIFKSLFFLVPFLIGVLGYLFTRIYFSITTNTAPGGGAHLFNITKIIRYPLRYFGQTLLPQDSILNIATIFTKSSGIAQTTVFSKISESLGILLAVSLFVLLIKFKDNYKNETKMLFISFAFLASSIFPYLLIPGQAGIFYIFPPRYLYFGLFGSTLILSCILNLVIKTKNKLFIRVLCLVLLFMVLNGVFDNINNAGFFYKEGALRNNILLTIKKDYPTLPVKSVFYITSDTPYYGLPDTEKILPFQSGFGQTLLVWYYQEEFPASFYQDRFLWGITDQGYKQKDGKGFGYFRDYSSLSESVKRNHLLPSSIISFSWEGKSNILMDTTSQTRNQLKQ